MKSADKYLISEKFPHSPQLCNHHFCSYFEIPRRMLSSWKDFLFGRSFFVELTDRMSPCCLYPVLRILTTCPLSLKPTMSASLRAPCLLLLGLLLSGSSGSSRVRVRVRIPPHDQVAQVARFVAHQCDWGSLATLSSHPPLQGRPFSNTFSLSDGPPGSGTGVPYLYLTRMEVSVQDLQVDPRASLSMSLAQTDYCRQQGFDPQSPLCAHIILSGSVLEINGTEADFAKKSLFSRHPEMIDWPSDHGWFFAKFNITQVWVLDYFGGVKTVTPEEYFQASLHTKHH